MTREEAIETVIKLFSEYNLTVQDILDYCMRKLAEETKEIKTRKEKLEAKGVVVK